MKIKDRTLISIVILIILAILIIKGHDSVLTYIVQSYAAASLLGDQIAERISRERKRKEG